MQLEKIKPEELKKIVQMLYWVANDNSLTQAKIAETVGLTESAVSRFLKQAKQQGWIENRYKLNIPGKFQEYLPPSRNFGLEKKLMDHYSQHSLRNIYVLKAERRQLHEESAKLLSKLILKDLNSQDPVRIIVGWGYTIKSIIKSVIIDDPLNNRNNPFSIYPLLGDFPLIHYESEFKGSTEEETKRDVVDRITSHSANQNAKQLSQILGLENQHIPITSPAIIWDTEDPDPSEKLESFLSLLHSLDYTLKRLYGNPVTGQKGIASTAATLLTSIGADLPEFSESIVGARLAARKKAEIGSDQFFNIGGILFDEKGNEIFPPNRRLVGLSLDIFKEISFNYIARYGTDRQTGHGIMVFGFSKQDGDTVLINNKAIPIKILLREKMINSLVIDETIAARL